MTLYESQDLPYQPLFCHVHYLLYIHSNQTERTLQTWLCLWNCLYLSRKHRHRWCKYCLLPPKMPEAPSIQNGCKAIVEAQHSVRAELHTVCKGSAAGPAASQHRVLSHRRFAEKSTVITCHITGGLPLTTSPELPSDSDLICSK